MILCKEQQMPATGYTWIESRYYRSLNLLYDAAWDTKPQNILANGS
ncbi:MAG: hypothetical protein J0H29_02645 [Sphingobacteriales bacterium]|nr:hypothetical protein [Sphingobacteriales bacterium]